jgi:hypothetical protein
MLLMVRNRPALVRWPVDLPPSAVEHKFECMRYWAPTVNRFRDEWLVFDERERVALIRKLEHFGPRKNWTLFRSVTWEERSEDRVLIGYFPSLDMAVYVTWQEWRKAHGRGIGPIAAE